MCLLARVHVPRTIHTLLHITYSKHSRCTCHLKIPADDEVAETLKFPLVEQNRIRPPVPMEVARPTGLLFLRVAETAFGTTRTSSCRDQMELGGLPTPQFL